MCDGNIRNDDSRYTSDGCDNSGDSCNNADGNGYVVVVVAVLMVVTVTTNYDDNNDDSSDDGISGGDDGGGVGGYGCGGSGDGVIVKCEKYVLFLTKKTKFTNFCFLVLKMIVKVF